MQNGEIDIRVKYFIKIFTFYFFFVIINICEVTMANKYFGPDCKILWKDRKRIFGLPLTFTRYEIVEKPGQWVKLFSHIGLLSTASEETHFYRIDDLSVYQSLFDKMFGVGTITVYCGDASNDSMILQKVKNPYKVRDMIASLAEKQRKERGMRYSELQG